MKQWILYKYLQKRMLHSVNNLHLSISRPLMSSSGRCVYKIADCGIWFRIRYHFIRSYFQTFRIFHNLNKLFGGWYCADWVLFRIEAELYYIHLDVLKEIIINITMYYIDVSLYKLTFEKAENVKKFNFCYCFYCKVFDVSWQAGVCYITKLIKNAQNVSGFQEV